MYVLFFKNLYDFDRFIHKRKINIIDWLCKFVTLRRNFPKSYEIRFVGNYVDGLGVANLFPNLLYSVCDIMKRSFICDREHHYKGVVRVIPSMILKEKTALSDFLTTKLTNLSKHFVTWFNVSIHNWKSWNKWKEPDQIYIATIFFLNLFIKFWNIFSIPECTYRLQQNQGWILDRLALLEPWYKTNLDLQGK